MPLKSNQNRTTGSSPSWRPHVWLIVGLVAVLLALTLVSGWGS